MTCKGNEKEEVNRIHFISSGRKKKKSLPKDRPLQYDGGNRFLHAALLVCFDPISFNIPFSLIFHLGGGFLVPSVNTYEEKQHGCTC